MIENEGITGTTEKTVMKNYDLLMIELQQYINIAHVPDVLKVMLLAKKPKKYRNLPWKIAVGRVLEYVQEHKHNFEGGRLRV